MPGHQAVFNLGRTHMDADHLGDLPSAVGATRTRHALAVVVAQAGDQLLCLSACGTHADRRRNSPRAWGIDDGVDGLVRDAQIRLIGMHPAQRASNLLGRACLRVRNARRQAQRCCAVAAA